jgi:hypothetical protein
MGFAEPTEPHRKSGMWDTTTLDLKICQPRSVIGLEISEYPRCTRRPGCRTALLADEPPTGPGPNTQSYYC